MKKLLILCISTLALAYSEPYDYNPFKKEDTKTSIKISKQTSKAIVVSAVMKDRAFINGKWYVKGQKFGAYRLLAIGKKFIELKKGTKSIILPVGKKSKRYFKLKDKK